MKSPLRYLIEGRTAGAVATATLLLSSLAQAGRCDAPPPVVPEANAGLALLPVVGAVLFFSARRLWGAKPSLRASDQRAQHELVA
jgi:hypothetical protein